MQRESRKPASVQSSSNYHCWIGFAAGLVFCTLATTGVAVAQSFSDSFEAPTLDPFWTVNEQFGSVQVSSDVSHTGSQSAKITSTTGGQRNIWIAHSFAAATKGILTAWFYDASAGAATLYAGLYANDSSNPSNDFSVNVADWNGTHYIWHGPGVSETATSVARSPGWHEFQLRVTEAGFEAAVDDITVGSVAGDFAFDTVLLLLSGPSFRPDATFYFDDFNFTPPAVPPSIHSLTAAPDVLWPPNHKMVAVSLAVSASGSPTPACQISAVTSNELPTKPGETDWEVTGPLMLGLRAERAGTGGGRTYVVEVTCTNAAGLAASTVVVSVPHDQR